MSILLVAASALCFVGFKLYSIGHYDGDENIYLYLAERMSQGQLPYRDFFHAHPPLHLLPLSLLSYAFGGSSIVAARVVGATACLLSGFLIYRSWERREPMLGAVACAVFLLGLGPLSHSSRFLGTNLATFWVALALTSLCAERDRIAALAFALGGFTFLAAAPAAVGATFVLLVADPARGLRLMITGGGCFVALNLIVWAVIGHPYLDQVYLYHLGKTAGTGDHFTVFHAVFSANTWIVGGAGLGAIALLLGVDPGNEARSDEETADEAGSLGRLRDLIDQRLPLYLHLGAAIGSMLFLATAPRIFVHYFQIALVCLSPLAGFGLVAFGKSLREASTRRSSQALFTAATLSLVFLSLQLPILNLHHVDEAERIAHAWRGSGVPVLDSVVRSLFWRDEEVPGKRMLGWTRYLWIEADVFESAVPLSREVVAHCGPSTTLFGDSTSAPLIALLAKRRLVLDLADTNHMRFKGSDASIDSLLAQIEEAPPCAVLERTDHGLFTLPGFRRWLEKHHEPVFRVQDAHGERSYTLHVRKT